MNEQERLMALGRKYIVAAYQILISDRADKTSPLFLGFPSPEKIIAVAQVIATADVKANRPENDTTMEHDHPGDIDEFDELWELEGPFDSDLHIEQWLDNPMPGDDLVVHEHDGDGHATGRAIRYKIMEVKMENLPMSIKELGVMDLQHIYARFIEKMEGGEPHD